MAGRHLFLVAGLAALGHSTDAFAFWPKCLTPRATDIPPSVSPYNPAPKDPTNPKDPKTEVLPPTPLTNPTNPTEPLIPPNQVQPNQLAGNDFLGGQGADTFAPNMFGDFFGGAKSRLLLAGSSSSRINLTGTATFSPAVLLAGSAFPGVGSIAVYNPNGSGSFFQLLVNKGTSTSINVQNKPYVGTFTQTINQLTFAVNPQTTDIFSQVINRLNSTPAGRQALLAALNRAYGTPNRVTLTAFETMTLGETGRAIPRTSNSGDLVYTYQVLATALQSRPYELGIAVANPTSGGTVGRTKVSEDNNPFPRDRLIFDYDYYSATQLSAAGVDVNHFAIGAEKTFFDRQASLEVRVPFASTLSNIVSLDGIASRDVELGNVNLIAKWLLTRDPALNFSVGLAAALPTAADSIVNSSNGAELIRIKNTSVLFTPYIAGIYTPNDRFFMQSWLSAGIDPIGNNIYYRNVNDGTTQKQRLHDISILSFDTQVGYWIARGNDAGELIQGLAPFVELHYNRGFNSGNQSATFGGVNVLQTKGNFDDLNVTLGLTAQLGSSIFFTNGLVLPLGNENNRFFDWQYGMRLNWLYGPTARAADSSLNGMRNQMSGR